MLNKYFEQLIDTFDQSNTDGEAYSLTIANRQVYLNFANSVLVSKLMPALAHHPQSKTDDQNDLTVYIWDSATSGIGLPEPPFNDVNKYMQQKDRWGLNLRSTDTSKPRVYYMPQPNEYMCFFDAEKKQAIYWFRDASTVPYYERGAPMRTLFDWWTESEGLLLTHGAAIGNDDGGVLLVGKGGQGKSTSAISSLYSERLFYVSDDYLILQSSPEPIAFSLYCSGKLNYDHLVNKFQDLLPMIDNPVTAPVEKGLFFAHKTHKEKIRLSLPITCAALPQVTDNQTTSFSPAPPFDLFFGLSVSTVYQSTGNPTHALATLRQTIYNLPCYYLKTGQDILDIPNGIEKIISKHAATH